MKMKTKTKVVMTGGNEGDEDSWGCHEDDSYYLVCHLIFEGFFSCYDTCGLSFDT